MANLKEVRNRIASVKSTQQITKAMKMVSAAKLRKATDRIIQMRPYADKLSGILKNLLASAEDISLDFATEREAKNVLIILITSDRGLCGGFNSNLVKTAIRTIKENYSDQAAKGNVSVGQMENLSGRTVYLSIVPVLLHSIINWDPHHRDSLPPQQNEIVCSNSL